MPSRNSRDAENDNGTKKLIVSNYVQYIALAVGILLLIFFVRQVGGVLLTFFLAVILAYILNPVVRRLEGLRIPRVISVIGLFLVLGTVVTTALLLLIVPAIQQARFLASNPEIIINAATELLDRARQIPYIGERVAATDGDALTRILRQNAPSAQAFVNTALGFVGGVFGVFGAIFNLFLLVIVSIYLLIDKERITGAALGMIPDTVRTQVVELLESVETAVVKLVRGQLLLCGIMGVVGWAIAFFTGTSYALLIGLWVGVMELIPVLGAFLGAIPAVVIALISSPTQALIVALLFLVAQQIEGNILVPKVMGGSVGVHPLWVLFAVLAGSALYGIVGAIFALPVVAIISATIRYLRGTLIFENWGKALVSPADSSESPRTESAAVASGSDGKED
ncbi:AI-2E family transporter [Rubrobacter aplysinae]|uniref:AI-2E family transporter n=1 Tax=Rubrobacter aplysinae TaxID=909625 RepID=UPI00064BF1FB|nr:AI-2E family transporter [Rubrobacter aplysinae]